MHKSYCIVAAVLFLLPNVSTAQNVTKEAGAYERKSVSFIDALWLADESALSMQPGEVREILDAVKRAVSMPRFDYNPIPESLQRDFADRARAMRMPYVNEATATAGGDDPMLDSIAAVMENTVVARVLEIVDMNKDMRAANLTSEQQRNSFMSDKAKSLGITMEDIQKVMNSAYIYLPVVRGYTTQLNDSMYTAGFAAGIVWFRIITAGEKARAIPVVKSVTYSSGFSMKDRTYATTSGLVGYQEYAFRSAVKNAARNLAVATQQIPEFKLSGQIVDRGFMSVGVNMGKREGLKVDDKFQMTEVTEDANGNQTTRKKGWVMVTRVADSLSKHGYKSKAQVIAGRPYIGAVLNEYPRLPLDLLIRGRMFAFTVRDTTTPLFDHLKLQNAYGGGLDVQYDIGKYMGLGQFFIGLSGGVGTGAVFGNKSDAYDAAQGADHGAAGLSWMLEWTAELSLVKKFYIGRLAIVLQPQGGYQSLVLVTGKGRGSYGDEYYSFTNAGIVFNANGGLEFALSPAVNIGVGAGYQMLGTNASWDYSCKAGSNGSWKKVATVKDATVDRTGITANVYLVWSLPSLAFDPVDMVHGMVGGIK
jgi:hypothetical protein